MASASANLESAGIPGVPGLAGAVPFPLGTDQVALELQNPLLSTPSFVNANGNGVNGWKKLSYTDMATAWDRGVALQSAFANINTDNPNLSAFKARNGKIILYHGLADTLTMPQGSINYYNRVAERIGSIAAVRDFYRFFRVPSMVHGFFNGAANPPLPNNEQLYAALTAWVETSVAPVTINAAVGATATTPAKSRPLCLYPLKAAYTNGDPNQPASYTCS